MLPKNKKKKRNSVKREWRLVNLGKNSERERLESEYGNMFITDPSYPSRIHRIKEGNLLRIVRKMKEKD